VRPDNNVVVRERLFKSRDELLEFLKNGLFEVPQTFGILPAHALGGPPKPLLLALFPDRLKQIQPRIKGIDVVEIGVDEYEISVSLF
jgi:hypothetical protein